MILWLLIITFIIIIIIMILIYIRYTILTIINTQVGGGVAAEAEQALNNIGNILAAAGGG